MLWLLPAIKYLHTKTPNYLHNFNITILVRLLRCSVCRTRIFFARHQSVTQTVMAAAKPAWCLPACLARLLALLQIAMTCGTIVAAWPWTHTGCTHVVFAHYHSTFLGSKQWNQQICWPWQSDEKRSSHISFKDEGHCMANYTSEMPISFIFKRFKLTRRTYTAVSENMNSSMWISLSYKKDVLALHK